MIPEKIINLMIKKLKAQLLQNMNQLSVAEHSKTVLLMDAPVKMALFS